MSNDYTPIPQDPMPTPPSPAPAPVKRGAVWQEWLLPLAVLAGFFLLIFAAALIIPRLRPQTHSGQRAAVFTKRLTFTSPLAPWDYTPVLAVDGTARVPALPQTLQVGAQRFAVAPVKPELGHWPVPTAPDQAAWLYGTQVNYVLGIAYREDLASAWQSLDESAVLTLTLDNGIVLQFGPPQVTLEAPTAALFAQRQPGLTALLLGGPEGEARWVLRAPYLPSVTLATGQTQSAGDVLITVQRVELVERKPERFLVVDYQLSYSGMASLTPDQLRLVLEDGNGARYQAEPLVLEGHPAPLTQSLTAGAALSASAVYRLADQPVLPLAWLVYVGQTSETPLRFALGYVPAQPAPAQAQVSVSQAWYEPEQNALRISGTVRNLGALPLLVNGTQFRLTSAQGEATLRSFSPMLPWSLSGGEQESFEVVFDRPAGVQTVTFEALGFVFQISGLP